MPLVTPRDRMSGRRLEDRIRELCARALYTREPEWGRIITELQLAIKEHELRVTNLTTAATVAGQPQLVRERRSS